jgi:hypothetical protein
MFLREYLGAKYAHFPTEYRDKEYLFAIDRAGAGVCQCMSDVRDAIQREVPCMIIKAVVGDPKSAIRMLDIESEFLADIQLPRKLAALIWKGWDESQDADDDDAEVGRETPATRAREARIDAGLFPIIEKSFVEPARGMLP